MREIETLVKILSPLAEVQKAVERCATFRETVRIQDVYWVDPQRPNVTGEGRGMVNALRLRHKGDRWLLTYEHDNMNEAGVWLYSDEFETEVQDGATMRAILEKLGFEERVTVTMQRHYFDSQEYTITLEEVDDLGLFLEVEAKSSDGDPAEVQHSIADFIASLGIRTEPVTAGKPELMYRKLHPTP